MTLMNKLGICLIATLVWVQTAMAAEATWLTDLAKAQAKAKEEKKLVLMDFTGSDWCPPCQALHKNVLTSKEFVDFAERQSCPAGGGFPPRQTAVRTANESQ